MKFRVLQLNVRKQDVVQMSLMNDRDLKDYSVLAISEPYARKIDDKVVTSPNHHSNWTKFIPSQLHETGWPIRSMIWVRTDLEAEQVSMKSADLTAVRVRLPDRDIMVVSVYVQGSNANALDSAIIELHQVITDFKGKGGGRTDVVLAGDFNRHDLLWGGDEISATTRQGEAQPILDLMDEHGLCSLLPRGTKTWQRRHSESTIDLVLASAELTDEMIKCDLHPTEHGSDHRAIETTFDVSVPERTVTPRLLFKNAPWAEIRARVKEQLEQAPWSGDVQQQADRLMGVVLEAVHDLTPQAKPSPYAKRWWTADLTQLRRIYACWRNLARQQRRQNRSVPDLEQRASEAAKEYHDAIRKQKKSHWKDFLSDEQNIWQAAKYLKPGVDTWSDKVPSLRKQDGSTTDGRGEQAAELLKTFFPPLPAVIENEGQRPHRRELPMHDLSMQEIEDKVMTASPWKAPGEDGLPSMVWRQLWSVVKDRVLHLFRTSLRDGQVPSQWRKAKIIPLKKPGKGDYTAAKAWRPISLLSTLGKILEAVVAERISYLVEKHGLLPTNHFGARKRRSAEQALLLLQEKVYSAWRSGRVLSLISFDVKGAYNGVFKDRLLQRLEARGIPKQLVSWVDAFCSHRTASILVNGHTSATRELPQAGLPQGSPLSPILFLFFNADLVQTRIDKNGGAIAFVDDYSAWVTGPTAEGNREGIQLIINRAVEWERRSGATFEGDKTVVVHFTRNTARSDKAPFLIKGRVVEPKSSAKILGVIMDSRLRYKEHMARAAAKGLSAAMCLKRLKMLPPRAARQLFTATVAPTMDYAASVWAHACGARELGWLRRAQRVGAQAITGAFRTVATAVAEAEAHIRPVEERHVQAIVKTWINTRTLSATHPLARLRIRDSRRFASPLQRAQELQAGLATVRLEVIKPYTLAPWEGRIHVAYDMSPEQAKETIQRSRGILIATSSSQKNERVGMGGCVRDAAVNDVDEFLARYSVTLGSREEQNPYTAELEAIAMALRCAAAGLRRCELTVISSNRSALQAIARPRQQSGQCSIREIYRLVKRLQANGVSVKMMWIPVNTNDFPLGSHAKSAAKQATGRGTTSETETFQARSIAVRLALARQRQAELPERVGKYSKRVDKALPGTHVRDLYNMLNRKEADTLAQLRTGMSRLNAFLHRIGAEDSDMCDCGHEPETTDHFLFRCARWREEREIMAKSARSRFGDLSYFLGGKTNRDSTKWAPDKQAVRAAIKFAMATKRLDREQHK